MEQIIIIQEWEKKNNALKALINLKLALPKYPLEEVNIDS